MPLASGRRSSPTISRASAPRRGRSRRCRFVPTCPSLTGDGDYLGALYVVEGSTLGGAFIARALAPIAGENRRFFLGHGGENGRLWRGFVARLDRLDAAPEQADAAERAADLTFAAFERWMANWRGAFARTPAAA